MAPSISTVESGVEAAVGVVAPVAHRGGTNPMRLSECKEEEGPVDPHRHVRSGGEVDGAIGNHRERAGV